MVWPAPCFHQKGQHELALHKRPGWFIDKVTSEVIGFCKSKQCPFLLQPQVIQQLQKKHPKTACLFLLCKFKLVLLVLYIWKLNFKVAVSRNRERMCFGHSRRPLIWICAWNTWHKCALPRKTQSLQYFTFYLAPFLQLLTQLRKDKHSRYLAWPLRLIWGCGMPWPWIYITHLAFKFIPWIHSWRPSGSFQTQLKVVSRAVQDDFNNRTVYHSYWEGTLRVPLASW